MTEEGTETQPQGSASGPAPAPIASEAEAVTDPTVDVLTVSERAEPVEP